MKKIIKYLLMFVIGGIIAVAIVEYREARNEAYRIEAMCNLSDARLVSSGMIDCRGVKEWKNY